MFWDHAGVMKKNKMIKHFKVFFFFLSMSTEKFYHADCQSLYIWYQQSPVIINKTPFTLGTSSASRPFNWTGEPCLDIPDSRYSLSGGHIREWTYFHFGYSKICEVAKRRMLHWCIYSCIFDIFISRTDIGLIIWTFTAAVYYILTFACELGIQVLM